MEEYIKADVDHPITYFNGGKFVATDRWKHMERHISDLYVAIINLNNVIYIEQNGQRYSIQPGDVFFLLPDQTHSGFDYSPPGTSYYWFHFTFSEPTKRLTKQEMDQEIISIRSSQTIDSMNTSILLPIHSTPKSMERLKISVKNLLDVENANFFNSCCKKYLATSLLIELSEQTIVNYHMGHKQSNSEKTITALKEWIRIHAFTNISVKMIAEEFKYNSDYLSRLFKASTGMSIQEYIHKLKLSKAKELLTNSNESIKSIATTIGFHDEKYFSKLFKKYENMTPTEYRKAYFRVLLNNF